METYFKDIIKPYFLKIMIILLNYVRLKQVIKYKFFQLHFMDLNLIMYIQKF